MSTLSATLGQLRRKEGSDGGVEWAQSLLADARAHCAGDVDLGLLCEAADALSGALESSDCPKRETLRAVCHDFIDLARLRSVRLAGLGEGADQQGWIQRVVGLIQQSDFTIGYLLRQRLVDYADHPLFVVPRGERVTQYTFQQVADLTDRLAGGIFSLLGDRPRVAL